MTSEKSKLLAYSSSDWNEALGLKGTEHCAYEISQHPIQDDAVVSGAIVAHQGAVLWKIAVLLNVAILKNVAAFTQYFLTG